MADLDDMEMAKCPHCGKTCPKDFFPLCSCERDIKAGKNPQKKSGEAGQPEKGEDDPYDYDF